MILTVVYGLMTFAVHWIRAEIQEYIVKNWRLVKLATNKKPAQTLFRSASNESQ